jgi:signal-transduction protein with cAMP-binding, CBS, and nucleotidyltransferase domain
MYTVREILQSKDSKLWTIKTNASVFEALQLMAEKNIGSLLVMENNKMQGIFSERDYARGIVLKGKSSKKTSVGELMTKNVIYVAPDDRIKECMALMTAKRVRHLPVYQDGELIGILSIGDIVKQIISDQEFTIKELEKYITGSY